MFTAFLLPTAGSQAIMMMPMMMTINVYLAHVGR